MKKLILALGATLLATGAAHAQTATQAPGAYAGVAVSSVGKMMRDGRKAQAKVFGGYDFDQNFGIEAGITNRSSETVSAQSNGQWVDFSTKGYNSYVAGKYTIPVSERVSAYGKLGMSYHVVRHSDSRGLRHKDDDTGLYAGLGVQYNINDKVAVTAEYERSGKREAFNDPNDAWSVGMKFGF
ncbi:porin family protein [Pseudoduganella sp. GCM10020061]|uniref:porin family protein n=1 Tax=Pseudoduganella sp. GCM10020061 TaxID=3317345 RepID=UPI00362E164E